MASNVFKQLMSLHWWMAIGYVLLFHSGEMISKAQGEVIDRELVLAAHKSFGVLVLFLLGWCRFSGWVLKFRGEE